jgi:site-specific recombinase XerC
MESVPLLIGPAGVGRRRPRPASTSGSRRGTRGCVPAAPRTVEEIITVMRAAGDSPEGVRLRGIIVVLWRAGLRISEVPALNETDLDPVHGSLVVRHGKGDKRREVGMDPWAWAHLDPWLELRSQLPVVRLFCVVRGPTQGRPCAAAGIRAQLHHAAAMAGPALVRAPPAQACAVQWRCRARGSR